jgi:hypothetical protein
MSLCEQQGTAAAATATAAAAETAAAAVPLSLTSPRLDVASKMSSFSMSVVAAVILAATSTSPATLEELPRNPTFASSDRTDICARMDSPLTFIEELMRRKLDSNKSYKGFVPTKTSSKYNFGF